MSEADELRTLLAFKDQLVLVKWRDITGGAESKVWLSKADLDELVPLETETVGRLVRVDADQGFLVLTGTTTTDDQFADVSAIPFGCLVSCHLLEHASPTPWIANGTPQPERDRVTFEHELRYPMAEGERRM
jgi:hypothetical protein